MSFLRKIQIPELILIVAIAVLGYLSLHPIDRWHASLHYPFQMDASEGFILEQATAIARGQSIYGPIDKPPYLVGNYPPLMPLIYAALNGPRVDLSSLILGRWLVISTTVLCALLLAAILCRLTRRFTPTLLAPLLFLVNYEVFLWSPLVRVDFPALSLTLAGLLAFVLSPRCLNLALAGLLFTAAAYTRQTAVLAPLACAVALAVHDRRRLAWFIGPAAIAGIVALIALQYMTSGQFLRHTIAYNANRMDWPIWLALMKNEIWFFYRWFIAATIAMAVAGFFFSARPGSDSHEKTVRAALGMYAVLGAISLLSYAKIGAGVNYVIEPLASTVIWLMLSLDSFMTSSAARSQRHRVVAAAICLLLLAHSGWLVHRQTQLFSTFTPAPLDKSIASGLAQYIRGIKGDILCEEPFFTMLAGQPVLFDPFIMSQLSKEGKWDQTPFVHMLENKYFARIVTNEDLMRPQTDYERYTPAMAEAVRKHYRRVDKVFAGGIPPGIVVLPGIRLRYFIYEPAPENR